MAKRFQSLKNKSEIIHKRFLLRQFKLIEGFEGMREVFGKTKPDFFYFSRDDGAAMFELKTKTYPKKNPRNKGLKQFAWFDMERKQIEGYEEVWGRKDKTRAWIYLIGFTQMPLSEIKNLGERSFFHRLIYVAPWEAHELVGYTKADRKYINPGRLQRNFEFDCKEIPKGELFLEKGLIEKIGKCFNF